MSPNTPIARPIPFTVVVRYFPEDVGHIHDGALPYNSVFAVTPVTQSKTATFNSKEITICNTCCMLYDGDKWGGIQEFENIDKYAIFLHFLLFLNE